MLRSQNKIGIKNYQKKKIVPWMFLVFLHRWYLQLAVTKLGMS